MLLCLYFLAGFMFVDLIFWFNPPVILEYYVDFQSTMNVSLIWELLHGPLDSGNTLKDSTVPKL